MKQGLKFGVQLIGYYAMCLLLCLLFLTSMSGTALWLQAVLNAALVAGFAIIMLNSGGYVGEKACSLTATLDKRRGEGHAIDPKQEAECWSKKTAIIAYLTATLPFLLLAVVNLIYYPVYEEYLSTLPPVPAAEEAAAINDAASLDGLTDPSLVDPDNDPGLVPVDVDEPLEVQDEYTLSYINWVATVTRVAFMPYVSLYTLLADKIMLLYILFIPLSLFLPAFGVIGYMMGPRLRRKKLDDIQKGAKRKKRNLKVNQKPRQPRGPKHEV